MPESAIQVFGPDGFRGTVLYPLPKSRNELARVRTEDGRILEVPASLLTRRPDGSYEIEQRPDDRNETVVPVLAEELDIGKRAVPTGGVRVHRRVLEHDETVELPLVKEHVDVRRVVIDREVDGPLPIRDEGETTIIPVVEEVLVVQKRFVLREEIHVTRTAREELHRENVTLRSQEAEIERVDEQGRADVRTDAPRRQPRRSILGE